MAAIFGEGKIFGKLQRLHSLDTLWVENFDEIAHFWGGENFWKIIENFDEIALSCTVKEIEAN